VALAVGSAVHRALEELDLGAADAAAELARQRARLPAYLAAAPEAERGRALDAAGKLLDRLAGSRLLARLQTLAPHVVARELPVLLPPETAPDATVLAPAPDEDGAGAPVGFVAGVIDLLYRDPETGAWVIADYKTDAVDPGPALQARAEVYAAQGRIYSLAVRGALGLDEDPRFELWFLAADRVVVPGAPAERRGPEPSPPPRQLGLF
jgi:ATP-dependent exoDNAse (exonuclease V) beta subunit